MARLSVTDVRTNPSIASYTACCAIPAPEVIAREREIVEDLTAALVEFEAVAAALEAASSSD